MRKFIILFIIISFIFPLIAFPQIKSNYIGVNFIYSMADLNSEETGGNGFGGEVLYNIFILKEIAFTLNIGFKYLSYNLNKQDPFEDPLLGTTTYIDYTEDIGFYSIPLGFTFNYVFLLTEKFIRSSSKFMKRLYPYIGTGLYSTFIYKTIEYKYKDTLTESEENFMSGIEENPTKWFPATATIPLIFGLYYKTSNKLLFNTGIKYSILIYDQFTEKYGYNNVFSVYIGMLYKIKSLF